MPPVLVFWHLYRIGEVERVPIRRRGLFYARPAGHPVSELPVPAAEDRVSVFHRRFIHFKIVHFGVTYNPR